jgi:hypothetical protein
VASVSSADDGLPAWIILLGAFDDRSDAAEFAAENESLAGLGSLEVLWIPDYGSLSGKTMYAVYAGPYPYADRAGVTRRLRSVQERYARAGKSSTPYAKKLDDAGPPEEIR